MGVFRPAVDLKKIRVGNEKKYEQAEVQAGHGSMCFCRAHGYLQCEKCEKHMLPGA